MLSSLEYATLLRYSPKGASAKAKISRQVRGALKNGDARTSIRVLEHILTNDLLSSFFGIDAIFIPVPRSAPLSDGALWPSKVIANTFAASPQFGQSVSTCLSRITSVPKSSYQANADNRPSVEQHYNSIIVAPEMLATKTLILIDDILTLGRTTLACASRLKEIYPDKTVKVFGVMRTRSFKDTNEILDPRVGVMKYNDRTGKVHMPD